MTENTSAQTKEEEIRATVARFSIEFLRRLQWQAGQMVPGADASFGGHVTADNVFQMTMEAQDWLTMARYGAGLAEEDPAYIYEICQGLAEWLFGIPDSNRYDIPGAWADSPMGALWWAAYIRAAGDALITVAEAADIAGVTVQAITNRVSRGSLDSFIDPAAPSRQGRRLVRRSDAQAIAEKRAGGAS